MFYEGHCGARTAQKARDSLDTEVALRADFIYVVAKATTHKDSVAGEFAARLLGLDDGLREKRAQAEEIVFF